MKSNLAVLGPEKNTPHLKPVKILYLLWEFNYRISFPVTFRPISYGVALSSLAWADKRSLSYFTHSICLIMNVCTDTETFTSTNLLIAVSLSLPLSSGCSRSIVLVFFLDSFLSFPFPHTRAHHPFVPCSVISSEN